MKISRALEIVELAKNIKKENSFKNTIDLAENLNIAVTYTKISKDFTAHSTPNRTIMLNKSYDKKSRNVMCAHEIGHILLGHNSVAFSHYTDLRSTNIKNTDETEADLFAVALLFNEEDFNIKLHNMSSYMLRATLDHNVNY